MIGPEQEALIGRVFETFVTEHHHGDLLHHIADANEDTHHSVVVNAMTLFEANMEVGDYFNAYPSDVLNIFDKVLQRKAVALTNDASVNHGGQQRPKEQNMRKTFHTRITGLPVCPELTRHTIPRSRDVGHFLSVTGTVIRTSVAKVLEYERDYMCTKCKHVFKAQADFDQFYTFVPPVCCPNPDDCNSFKFTCLSGGSEPAACRDYQEIKIQEQVQRLSVGSIPRSLVVVLEDDLVDSCKSGDDVTVYGVMSLRWKPFVDGVRCDVELVLKANNIEVNNQQAAAALLAKDVQKDFDEFWDSYKYDSLAGRNQILLSLCPKVFGMYVIKLAVAMVLAGGVQRIDSSGTKVRGECHMLLVGDPGTGKSQFLKYAAKIISRSVLTAGIGSTSAGLTVAAVKDGGEWHLEAGALVLSDGGLCCIDEFNSIKEHDRISIHEAMEQQSISVAKAGMVCKLNTRTSILAATNPKGQYDPSEPLSVNVALASPLLSRFDLVLVLRDTKNPQWDQTISSFILEDRGPPAGSSALWPMEKMKSYFSIIKQLQPQMSEEAKWILTRYYQLQRQHGGRNAARTTIRMLESLSRLAEAHARLMFRETVTIEDAVTAVSVMECSMQGGSLLGNVNALLTSFPDDPVQQYQTQCQILLEGLNLPLLLQSEMDRLSRLRSSMSFNSDPTENQQHQVRTTNTQTVDLSCDSEGGVTANKSSFHPSPLPDLLAPPLITSTQENLNMDPDRSAAAEESSRQTEDGSNPSGSLFFASEKERNKENVEGLEGKIQEDLHHSEIQKQFGSAFLKVSKSLKDKRVQQPVLSHQQCDGEVGGGGGGNVADKTLHVQGQMSAEKADETKNIQPGPSSGSGPKPGSGPGLGVDQHLNFSAFMFRPKKMKPSNHSITTLNTETSVGQVQRAKKETQKHKTGSEGVSRGKPDGRGDGSSKTLQGVGSFKKDKEVPQSTVTEKNSRSGSVCVPGDARTLSPSLNPNNSSVSPKNSPLNPNSLSLSPKNSPLNPKNSSLNSNNSSLNPKASSENQSALKSDHIKAVVSASAIAKLSRFSFSCTTEPSTAQTNEGSPPQRENTEKPKSAANKTTNYMKGKPSLDPTDKVKNMLTLVVPTAGEKHQLRTEPAAETADRTSGSSVNPRKRKCFHLGRLPNDGSKHFLSELSLFGSAEVFNEVLDTDWDQEVLKS